MMQVPGVGPVVTETLDPSKTTLVLCHHGVRSFRAASFLAQQVGMLFVGRRSFPGYPIHAAMHADLSTACPESLTNVLFVVMQGFEDVRNISGGIDAYSRVADSSVPLY